MKLTIKPTSGYGDDFEVVLERANSDSEHELVALTKSLERAALQVSGVQAANHVLRWQNKSSVIGLRLDQATREDPRGRARLVGDLLAFGDATHMRYHPLPIVDWLTWPYRVRHVPPDADALLVYGPDVARFERLQALRLPTIEPWLTGRRPVRDRATFVAFHNMGAHEQSLVRTLLEGGRLWIAPDCPDGCHKSWILRYIDKLIAEGWATGADRYRDVHPGPRMALLNQAAGEPMSR